MRGSGLALAVAAISAACGGSSSPGSGGGGSANFSGALTGIAPIAVSASQASNGLLGLTVQSTSATAPHLQGTITIQNGSALQATTYTGGSSAMRATVTAYQPPAGAANYQATAIGDAANDQGTFSITFTSTGTAITSGGFSTWPLAHGTFAATMPAVPSSAGGTATGTATVTGTF